MYFGEIISQAFTVSRASRQRKADVKFVCDYYRVVKIYLRKNAHEKYSTKYSLWELEEPKECLWCLYNRRVSQTVRPHIGVEVLTSPVLTNHENTRGLVVRSCNEWSSLDLENATGRNCNNTKAKMNLFLINKHNVFFLNFQSLDTNFQD